MTRIVSRHRTNEDSSKTQLKSSRLRIRGCMKRTRFYKI